MSYQMRPSDVLLRNVCLSYVRFEKAVSRNPGQEKKYSCMILVPKTDLAQKQAIDNAIEAAIAIGREKYGNAVPPKPKTVLWDGDGYTQSGKEFGSETKGPGYSRRGLRKRAAPCRWLISIGIRSSIRARSTAACTPTSLWASTFTRTNRSASAQVSAPYRRWRTVSLWAVFFPRRMMCSVHRTRRHRWQGRHTQPHNRAYLLRWRSLRCSRRSTR